MSDLNSYWQSVVDALNHQRYRFRIKWSGDDKMTDWQPWVICPVPGYLETGILGPVPMREVQWLDVSNVDVAGVDLRDSVIEALHSAGATLSDTNDSIRVTWNVI